MKDPDRQVCGEGIKSLQSAGVDVVVGVLEDLVAEQLAPYVHHRNTGRPYVILKIATTLDGKVAAPDGSSQWITGPEARREGHKLRAYSDAICVGRGTVISDNPQLTVRDWSADDDIDKNLDPRRIVLGSVPAEAAIHPCYEFRGDLFELLDELGNDGVLQLLVEGGASTYKAFHDLGLVNEYQLFLAPAFMGGSDGLSIFSGDSSQSMTDLWRGKIQDVVELGNDIKVTVVPEHN
jgi:diaminohydroxyphosphoribosylaminopyrimidine deaminase/5-amino-6-(5-phosphoribosylamino)uracil reductase